MPKQSTTDSAHVMTEGQFRGVWRMHTRIERAYRACGNNKLAEQAKQARERLEARYPQFDPPSDDSLLTLEQKGEQS